MHHDAGTTGLSELIPVTEKLPLIQSDIASSSPLFRGPTSAVPGLQPYSDALDNSPIATKALTSLVGWLFGDLIAQVSLNMNQLQCHLLILSYLSNHPSVINRSSLREGPLIACALPLSVRSGSSSMAPLDTSSTAGLNQQSPGLMPFVSALRLPSTSSFGVPCS